MANRPEENWTKSPHVPALPWAMIAKLNLNSAMNFRRFAPANSATPFQKFAFEIRRHGGLMIIYHSRFLTRGEVWFDNEATSEPVDWIIFHQRSQPIGKGKWRPFYTRIIDLTQPPDALLAQMDGFTASDIKKAAKKDQTFCRKMDSRDQTALREFADFYDRFAAIKHLGVADRPWLERTAQAGK